MLSINAHIALLLGLILGWVLSHFVYEPQGSSKWAIGPPTARNTLVWRCLHLIWLCGPFYEKFSLQIRCGSLWWGRVSHFCNASRPADHLCWRTPRLAYFDVFSLLFAVKLQGKGIASRGMGVVNTRTGGANSATCTPGPRLILQVKYDH